MIRDVYHVSDIQNLLFQIDSVLPAKGTIISCDWKTMEERLRDVCKPADGHEFVGLEVKYIVVPTYVDDPNGAARASTEVIVVGPITGPYEKLFELF